MNKENISIGTFIRNWLFLKKKAIQLSWAIRLCDLKQQAFNRRYFVILDHNDKLISLSKEDINNLKRRKLINKGITHLDLMEKSFYYTPLSRNNISGLSKEEKLLRKKTFLEYMRYKGWIRPLPNRGMELI